MTGEYEELRRKIARRHPDFRLVFDPPDLNWTRLRDDLDENEAVALMFVPPGEHDEAEAAEPPSADAPLAHFLASVIDHAGARFVDVPDLTVVHGLLAIHDVRRRVPAGASASDLAATNFPSTFSSSDPRTDRGPRVSHRVARLRRLFRREDEGDGIADTASVPAPVVAEELEQALWVPLVAACPHVRRWHLVLHHAARNLPVQLGAPEGHQVLVHAGVAFYGFGRERMRAAAERANIAPLAASEVAVHVDDARLSAASPTARSTSTQLGRTQEIPFVNAEAALVRAIHGLAARVVIGAATEALLAAPDPAVRLFCAAAHGDEVFDGETKTWRTALVLSLQERLWLDRSAVVLAAQRPALVWLSCCLSGREADDKWGETQGVMTACFLKGARFVSAPLQAIDDLYAPLLSGLFHWHLKAGLSPGAAHERAGADLLSGSWPVGFLAMAEAAYAPVIADLLEREAVEPFCCADLVPLLNDWGWPERDSTLRLGLDATKRYELAEQIADKVLGEAAAAPADRPEEVQESLENLVGYTTPFGFG